MFYVSVQTRRRVHTRHKLNATQAARETMKSDPPGHHRGSSTSLHNMHRVNTGLGLYDAYQRKHRVSTLRTVLNVCPVVHATRNHRSTGVEALESALAPVKWNNTPLTVPLPAAVRGEGSYVRAAGAPKHPAC